MPLPEWKGSKNPCQEDKYSRGSERELKQMCRERYIKVKRVFLTTGVPRVVKCVRVHVCVLGQVFGRHRATSRGPEMYPGLSPAVLKAALSTAGLLGL